MIIIRSQQRVATKSKSNFLWRTQDGCILKPSQMKTTHLFHVVRMIWNHTVPTEFQIEGNRYNGVNSWAIEKRKTVIKEMLQELSIRTDLSPSILADLNFMRQTSQERLI